MMIRNSGSGSGTKFILQSFSFQISAWASWLRRIVATVSIAQLKKRAKCTLVQALRRYTARTAHRGSRGIAVLYRH